MSMKISLIGKPICEVSATSQLRKKKRYSPEIEVLFGGILGEEQRKKDPCRNLRWFQISDL